MQKWLLILIALSISGFLAGCAVVQERLATDIEDFQSLAQKYGEPSDQACAAVLVAQQQALTDLREEDAKGIISLVYRGILIDRIMMIVERQIAINCGQFAVEVAARIGRKLR